ncbi:hypothetical protein GCM10009775_30840 [Microbacterium aoyamense]|uniref:ABC-2 type transport system permease protein n=1 Tax=Microbacterium aoyamense TaxID=344166 RepID=A0ABN2PX61_9MICO|nr:hypothetical protein [Microbacterium aoyamense]
MAAHVLRLRIALLVGALRGDAGRATRIVIGLILLTTAIVAACWALLTLRDAADEVALAVTVLCGSAISLGFALAPVVAAADDPLDPRRFALLGMPHGRLAAVLVLAGFVSVPIAALLAFAITGAVLWGAHGVPWVAGAASVILVAATCVLLARVCMALTSLFLRERRSRELTGLFVLAILVVVVPVGVFLASLEWDGTVPSQLSEAVDVLALTPFGAAWAFPGLLAQGDPGAGLSLAIAVLSLALLGLLWWWLVRRLLTTTERPASGRERSGLGWFGVAPGTAGGAIAARSLQYWFRDRRYVMNLVVIPIAAAVAPVPLLIAGVPPEIALLLPVLLAALFLGWLPHNDLAYDSTAVWMHLASGVRGISDRVGRLVPVLLVGVPLLAVAIPVSVAAYGRWMLLPALTGVCVSLFFSALGLSSISSAVAPYAVSRPGESPFQQPQRVGSSGAIAQALVMFGAIAVSAPVLWLAWLVMTGEPERATVALWTGVGVGAVVFAIGIGLGSLAFERRGSRLMEFAEAT